MGIESIRQYLERLGIEVVSADESSIRTRHKIGEISYEIQGFINNGFPYMSPEFYLIDRSSYGLIAHVGWPRGNDLGLICSGASDVVSLNYHMPEKIYEATLNKARETIEPVLEDASENQKQCLEEFYGHWKWASGSGGDYLFVVAPQQLSVTELKVKNRGTKRCHLATSLNTSGVGENYCLISNVEKSKAHSHVNGMFIPLTNLAAPPAPNEDIKEWWKGLLTFQREELLSDLQSKSIRLHKVKSFWIVCQGSHGGIETWFGIKAESDKKRRLPIHPNHLTDWKFRPIEVDVHSKSRLLPRGGASTDFQDKKVTLIGCGSVGSQIAEQLVCAGIGKLHLVDIDSFRSENLYRHKLNMNFAGANKAKGMAIKLQHEYPYTTITNDEERLLNIPIDKLSSADLIIVAIGSPTDERAFNEKLFNEGVNVPVIYCWLEGFGVAGHMVYVAGDHKSGCLECAYISPETGDIRMHSSMNFLMANEPVAKDIGGCGTLFLPYSHLDAIQTSTMVSREAVEVLSGKAEKSFKQSWVGSDRDAKKAGIAFTCQNDEIVEGSIIRSGLEQSQCPCCYMPEIGCSYSGHGKIIHVMKPVLEVWDKYRQTCSQDAEACGILVGSIDEDGSRIWLEAATEPMDADVRRRSAFHMRDKGHQATLNRLNENSRGRLVFLGTWHSHPEASPSFSNPDKTGWKKCVSANPPLEHFCFAIVGTETDSIFIPKKSSFEATRKMREL